MRRVTNTPLANEIYPMEYEKNYISFLSDENGIYNRYLGRFDSTISFIDTATHYRHYTETFPISDYARNILNQDIVPSIGKYSQILAKDRRYYMQVQDQIPASSIVPLDIQNTAYMDQLENISGGQSKKDEVVKDPETGEVKRKSGKGFSTVRRSDAVKEIEEIISADTTENKGEFDINDYQFDQKDFDPDHNKNWEYTIIDVHLPGQDEKDKDEPPKRLNYNVEYFLSQIVTQIDFSYLNQTYQPFTGGTSPVYLNPGFNAMFKVGVTDLLEDHRITGGLRLSLDLVNNEYLLSYANLKKRLDKEIIFHRNSIENYGPYFTIVRVYTHELFYVLKYPLNPIMALKGTAQYRNDMGVFLSTDVPTLSEPNVYVHTAGIKGEFIYDNTKNLGLNLYHGTRFKIFGEYFYALGEDNNDLAVVGFDFRNYQRIHRTFIWANRSRQYLHHQMLQVGNY